MVWSILTCCLHTSPFFFAGRQPASSYKHTPVQVRPPEPLSRLHPVCDQWVTSRLGSVGSCARLMVLSEFLSGQNVTKCSTRRCRGELPRFYVSGLAGNNVVLEGFKSHLRCPKLQHLLPHDSGTCSASALTAWRCFLPGFINLSRGCRGILVHSYLQRRFSSLRCGGICLGSVFWRSNPSVTVRLRSGLWMDRCSVLTFFLSHSLVDLLPCFVSLSRWLQALSGNRPHLWL